MIEAWPRLPEALQAALTDLADALANELEKAGTPETPNPITE